MPPKKQGKFKKDFANRLDKILEDLELNPDQFGKINVKKERKKESLENYRPSFNPDRFNNVISTEFSEEKVTFSQNYMKKPKTNSKKELIKDLERAKKREKELKRERLLNQQDQELDEEMDDFVRVMKEAHSRRSKTTFKTEILSQKKPKHFDSNRKYERKEKYDKGKEGHIEPFEEYLSFDAVQKGITDGGLYQVT